MLLEGGVGAGGSGAPAGGAATSLGCSRLSAARLRFFCCFAFLITTWARRSTWVPSGVVAVTTMV